MKTLKLLFPFLFCLLLINAHAQIIHVPGDQPSIQAGIDAANFWGDTVLVDEGLYYENIDFSGKRITVASEFIMDGDTNHINNTIIDGSQPSNPDNGSVVYFQTQEDTFSILHGFTITGGTGTWMPNINVRVSGGILILNCGAKILNNHIIDNHIVSNGAGSSGGIGAGDKFINNDYVVIKDNRISNNTVNAYTGAEGGGITLFCNGIVTDNVITNNIISAQTATASGGGVRFYGEDGGGGENRNIIVSRNIIANNEAHSNSSSENAGAAGMQVYKCNGIVSDNKIMSNAITSNNLSLGAGLFLAYCSTSLTAENNYISDNTADLYEPGGIGGGIYLAAASVKLINNLILSNYAAYGAGIYNDYNDVGPTQIINNTIAFNEGEEEGGAIYLREADAIVLNSILWDNYVPGGGEIYLDGGSIEVAYSDVFGGWTGAGNIDVDPDFVDDTCHLSCIDNPCIDVGIVDFTFSGTKYDAPLYDFDGEERPMDAGFDMGADESKICVGIAEISASANFNLKANPNPTSGIATLIYKIEEHSPVDLSILNMNGDVFEIITIGDQTQGEHSFSLDLSHLPNGLYLIRLQAGERVETTKIILHK